MFDIQIEQIISARKKNLDASEYFVQIKRANRKAEALEATKTILDFDPSWTTAQYQYAMSLIRAGNHKEALPYFLSCTKTHVEWMSALYHLGICQLKLGNEEEAIRSLKRVLHIDYKDDPEEYCKSFETLGDLFFSIARKSPDKNFRDKIINELNKICDMDIEKNGEQPWNLLYLGAVNFYRHKTTEALAIFEKASTKADRENLNKPFFFKSAYGCYSTKSFRTLNAMISAPDIKTLPEIELAPKKTSELVAFVSCDPEYFNRFSECFLSTIKETNSEVTVHFHVIGQAESIAKQRGANLDLIRTNKKIDIQYSFERKPDHNNTTYYALSRFINAHRIIQHYNSPIVICDIDSAVIGDLKLVKSFVGQNDVGVDANYDQNAFRKYPWNSISGGYLYINNTNRGIEYAKTLSKLMMEIFDPSSPKTWWLDQSVLYSTTFYLSLIHI